MKAAKKIRTIVTKAILAFALVITSITNSMAIGLPEFLDKRTNDSPSITFYVVISVVILIGVIIAIITSREPSTGERN